MKHFLSIVLLALFVGVVVYFVTHNRAEAPTNPVPGLEQTATSTAALEEVDTLYGLSFSFDESTYTVETHEDASRDDLIAAYSIFSTTDYEAMRASTIPREAPTSLSIEVFRNPMNLPVSEWVSTNERSNYALRVGEGKTARMGQMDYFTYTYDGLYRAEAYAYAHEGYVFIFSNMYLDAQSAMKKDMDDVVKTAVYRTPQVLAQTAHGNIKVITPKQGAEVSSPLKVEGIARGMWYFEATFPIVVVNWDGLIIAEGFAEAQGDWMTEDFVPFVGTLTFTKPEYGERGAIILQKSNASGLPENDDAIEIPILFK